MALWRFRSVHSVQEHEPFVQFPIKWGIVEKKRFGVSSILSEALRKESCEAMFESVSIESITTAGIEGRRRALGSPIVMVIGLTAYTRRRIRTHAISFARKNNDKCELARV